MTEMSDPDSLDKSRRAARRWVYVISAVGCLGILLVVGIVLAIFLWPWFVHFVG